MDQRFLALASGLLEQYAGKIAQALAPLSEEQVWWRPNGASNSAGNLVLHLCGNLSQWVLLGMGGHPYERRRSLEFTAEKTAGKAELLARLSGVVREARRLLAGLGAAELLAPKRIQGYETDGLGAVLQAVEHMSYHTGQIVFLAKALLGPAAGIDFYPQHRDE